MFEVEAAILVGAGIGVTPFVSILRTIVDHIWERRGVNDRRGKPCLPKKVLFFWIGYRPEVEAFRWFLDQLALWEKKFEEIHGRPENADLYLDIQLYLTLRTAKDAAADYNQLKIDTRKGLVPVADLDSKMIRTAELQRLQGELTQARSSQSENARRRSMMDDEGDASAATSNPWDAEHALTSDSGTAPPATSGSRRRAPSLGSQDDLQASRQSEGSKAGRSMGAPDPISGLKAPTVFGRPNWDKIFDDVVAQCAAAAAAAALSPSPCAGTTSKPGTSCSVAPALSKSRSKKPAGCSPPTPSSLPPPPLSPWPPQEQDHAARGLQLPRRELLNYQPHNPQRTYARTPASRACAY